MIEPVPGPDGVVRCPWSLGVPEMLDYHDDEWGFPVGDDVRLFEKVSLEGFQSGLSWRTILAKRPAFREAFSGFDVEAVARFGDDDVERLVGNAAIVRHRGKISAVVNNARRALELMEQEGSLAAYLWRFEPEASEVPEPQGLTTSPSSVALSKDLKKRGWKFVGPTTMFALMQAMGLVNDHVHGCATRAAVTEARSSFIRP